MKKTKNLHEYVREFKTAQKVAVDKVNAEFTPDEELHEDRNKMNLEWNIDEKKYQIHEQWIYGLFELIESKNPLCTREEAQTIANLLLDDFPLSKWEFLKLCVSGDIDR